jgi:hypothetical protein
MAGKALGVVPGLPGQGSFGDALFNQYGAERDVNNRRIDELIQQMIPTQFKQ